MVENNNSSFITILTDDEKQILHTVALNAIKEKDERLKRKKQSFKDLVKAVAEFKEKEFITLPVDTVKELQAILNKEAKVLKFLVEIRFVKE